MPWDLPANGTSSDFHRLIGEIHSPYDETEWIVKWDNSTDIQRVNISLEIFRGAFFQKNTLYFLRTGRYYWTQGFTELVFKELGTDGNFKNSSGIQKTNSFGRVDDVVAFSDQVYGISHMKYGPIPRSFVRKLNVTSGSVRLERKTVCMTNVRF